MTLPEIEGSPPSQPPTIITATLNPLMGHISTAYAAKLGNDLALCSRFEFNAYSYESDLSIGAEWWLRQKLKNRAIRRAGPESRPGNQRQLLQAGVDEDPVTSEFWKSAFDPVVGVLKARASTNSVRARAFLSNAPPKP